MVRTRTSSYAPPMGDDLPRSSVHPPTSPVPATAANRYPICIGCGCDLSGIPAEGVCPECALPVLRTLQGDRLQFSPPEYLAMLQRGATIVAAGVLAWLILHAAIFGMALLTGTWLDDPPPEPHFVLSWLTGTALLVALYGWWVMAAPDASVALRERRLNGRRAIRCLVLAAGAATVADRALPHGGPDISPLTIVTPMIWLAHFIAAMLYTRHLAGRIPDVRLQRLAMATLVGAMLMFVPCVPCMLVTLTFGPWVINLFVLVTALAFRTAVGRLSAAAHIT